MEGRNIKGYQLMLFDSHCHPQFPQYNEDRDEMLKRTLKEGVFMLCVGTDLETSEKAIELAGKYEGVWATVGLHPNDNLNEKFNTNIYEKLLSENKVVGFGEIGLDYYRTEKTEERKVQKQRFKEQLNLAAKIGKPVVLHCREAHPERSRELNRAGGSIQQRASASYGAHKDMLEILDSNLRGVIHSFTGTLEEAKKYLGLGFYLGFNGIITFTEQYDEIVRYVSLEKILLETDAPYLTPVPFRGKRNEPLYVKYVAEKIAGLKSLGYSQVVEQTFENTKKLFGIK